MAVDKKVCSLCEKSKSIKSFYKTNNPFIEDDSRIDMCSDCVHESVDEQNINEVIEFLRILNKPFIREVWDEALNKDVRTIGEYLRVINVKKAYKTLAFSDSDNLNTGGSDAEITLGDIRQIKTDSGKIITYDSSLVEKWGAGFEIFEYLKLEKYYVDMMHFNEINTTVHKEMLTQLAIMSVKRDKLLRSDNINDHNKLSATYEKTLESAGFRPKDRRGADEERGIRTFSQMFEEVEKQGFKIPPPPEVDDKDRAMEDQYYQKDMIDKMLVSILNYYHRLFSRELLSESPAEVMDDFFEGELDEALVEEYIKNSELIPEVDEDTLTEIPQEDDEE